MAGEDYTTSDTNPNRRYYPANAIIIEEGTPDDGSIYILEKGTLGVFKDEDMVSEISEPGTIVGEMAPILETPRTATIKAITECEITVYTGDLRERLIERLPPITQNLVIAITQRLQRQTAVHAEDRTRIRDLEKENQQLREQVVDLTRQLEDLKKAQ